MRKLLALLFFVTFGLTMVNAQSMPDAYLRYIKAGNTLREANQFERAETFLKRGLDEAKAKNQKYWEAVANEYLALLYRDTSRETEAIRSFNKALEIYRTLNLKISERGLLDLSSGLKGVGDDYAGIDIGSKGVKLNILTVTLNTKAQYEYTGKFDNTKNTDPMVLSNQSNAATLQAVRDYISTALTQYKVAKERLFIVVSSGLKQEMDKKDKEADFNQQVLGPLQAEGYKIDYITAAQEAEYLAKGIVPPRQIGTVSVLDIGSGNTKGGAYVNNAQFESFSLALGTKSFTNDIKQYVSKDVTEYGNNAKILIEAKLKAEIGEELGRHPIMKNRPNVYLSGGIIWAVASYIHPEKSNDIFVDITTADIRSFRDLATTNYQQLINPDLSKIDDDKVFEKAKSEIEKVRTTFDQEALIAGSTWLDALINDLNQSGPRKKLYFARQGVVGWLTGYILKVVSDEYSRTNEGSN